jgi:hypothetical protein
METTTNPPWGHELAHLVGQAIEKGLETGTVRCNHSPAEIARGDVTDLNFEVDSNYSQQAFKPLGDQIGSGSER